jgi:murein L,D-transpeptidase YcbB/YkuD
VAATALAAPAQVNAASVQPVEIVSASLRSTLAADRELADFYRSRDYRPLWIAGSSLRPEALRVLELIENARNDGLDPASYQFHELTAAVRRASDGSPASLAAAEALLSRAFSAYIRDLRRPRSVEMLYVDPELTPATLSPRAVLAAAAEAQSLSGHIDAAVRMNPIYTQLRRAFAAYRAANSGLGSQENVFQTNLERARALPADMGRRFILVDAASARLWMYEDGEAKDTMRVVVGRASEQTPLIAGFIRFATLNPYWNVPPDLVQRRIAPEVLSQGVSYLRTAKYEVLSDWTEDATVIDPSTVDWAGVAAGRVDLPVRQTPGAHNSMGNIKFMFPNERGVYLHDTPNKTLFEQSDRRQSSGCVRVEDAARLSRWLFQRELRSPSSAPEQNVELPERVPVYITYLTATPERGRIAFHEDVYGRDRQLLAQLGGGTAAAAR